MKVLSISSDKIYPITKAYALKGTLLPQANLQSLAEAKDLADLITRLKATAYAEAVSKIQAPYSAYKIELAAREHVSTLHYDFMKVYPKMDIFYAYYMKYIVGDLKTVLKGKAIGRSFEEIQRYLNMHAEELIRRRDLIARAVAAANLDELVNLFKRAEFYEVIENAVKTYKTAQKLDVFDVYLDKALYEGIIRAFTKKRLRRKINGKLRSIVSVDIDSYNVLAILRAKTWEVPQSQTRSLIVEPTFDISKDTLEDMITATSIPDAVMYLIRTPYRKLIPQAEGDVATISALEESFKRLGYGRATYPFLFEPFSESVVLSLVRLKELEARNISAIAFGIEHNLGPKAIMQKLISTK